MEITCIVGHLICEECWDIFKNNNDNNELYCPKCENDESMDTKESVTAQPITRFTKYQISNFDMYCVNNKLNQNNNNNVICDWKGKLKDLKNHTTKQCILRKEVCIHCNNEFIYDEWQIHQETCSMKRILLFRVNIQDGIHINEIIFLYFQQQISMHH